MPSPYGTCIFINDASYEELFYVLKLHKDLMREKYSNGAGKEVSMLNSYLQTQVNIDAFTGIR